MKENNINNKDNSNVEVSIVKIENKINEILDEYMSTINSFRSSKGTFNSKYLSYRPWIQLDLEGNISLNMKYINPNLTTESIDKFDINSIKESDAVVVKRNIKKLEKMLFHKLPVNNRVASDEGKNITSIISINNGEFNLIVDVLSSHRVKYTEFVPGSGSKFNKESDKAIAKTEGNFNGITVKSTVVSEIDFLSNLTTHDKNSALDNINKAYSSMNELPKQLYRILVDKYIRLKANNMLNGSNAYISLEDIHFNYRQLIGGGETGRSIKKDARAQYMEALKELEKYTVEIDFSNASQHLIKYSGIRKKKRIISNSKLVVVTSILTNKDLDKNTRASDSNDIVGFYYQLGEVGDLYLDEYKSITQFNYAYPRLALNLDTRTHSAALNICEYIAYEHRLRLNKKNPELFVSMEKLLSISNYDLDYSRFKRSIERFIGNQLKKAVDVLTESKTISSVEIPEKLSAKDKGYLSEIYVKFTLNYTDEVINSILK